MSRAQAKAAEGVPKGTSRSTLMSTAQLQMRRLSQWSREMRTRPSDQDELTDDDVQLENMLWGYCFSANGTKVLKLEELKAALAPLGERFY